ncbi:hypothetical protein [Nocardia sp. NBC_00511]|uniref:hypothetical protein n=1 Tax=Nocardia sp. NBC_00511 TaxID=2903591 RepID=UPI0030DF0276
MAGTTVPRPPFSTELLADLHAGGIPPEASELLWSEVRQDPEAMNYLQSLDRVDTRLRDLGRDDTLVHPMPAQVADRLERMIDNLAVDAPAEKLATVHRLPVAPPAVTRSTHPAPANTAPMPALNVGIFDTGRLDPSEIPTLEADPTLDTGEHPLPEPQRPSRRLRWITAAAAVAALLAGAVVAVDALSNRTVAPAALPAASTELDSTSMTPSMVLTAMGRHDISGPLATGNALSSCLQAAGLDRPILGTRSVTFSGTPGILVLLAGPKPPQITAAVLGTGCGPGNPQVLGRADIG